MKQCCICNIRLHKSRGHTCYDPTEPGQKWSCTKCVVAGKAEGLEPGPYNATRGRGRGFRIKRRRKTKPLVTFSGISMTGTGKKRTW